MAQYNSRPHTPRSVTGPQAGPPSRGSVAEHAGRTARHAGEYPARQGPAPITRLAAGPPTGHAGGERTAHHGTGHAGEQGTVHVAKPDLTINKVLAGAGAAATTAVVGSSFGATGTVVGAALGSVVTTLGTTLYQRSLDRTRDTVLQRIKVPGRGVTTIAVPVDPQATVPLQRTPQQRGRDAAGRAMLEPVPPRRSRRTLAIALASMVAAFVAGLLVITGVEWIKGAPISGGGSGTSVSRVVSGPGDTPAEQRQDGDTGAGGADGTGGAGTTGTGTTGSSTPTTSPAPAPQQGSGGSTRDADPSGGPTSTTTPRSGGTGGSGGSAGTSAATPDGSQDTPQ